MYSSTTIRLNILVDFILYLYKPMLLVLQQSEKGKILPISIPSGICLDLYPCTFISLLYGMKNLMKINSFINPKQDTHFFYYALPTWLLANKSHLLIIQLFYPLPLYFHHPMHLLYTHNYYTIPINCITWIFTSSCFIVFISLSFSFQRYQFRHIYSSTIITCLNECHW